MDIVGGGGVGVGSPLGFEQEEKLMIRRRHSSLVMTLMKVRMNNQDKYFHLITIEMVIQLLSKGWCNGDGHTHSY